MKNSSQKTTTVFFENAAGSYYRERYGNRRDINTFGMMNRLDAVLELLDKYGEAGGVCIDLGCGPASVFEPLAERGYEYVGLDIAFSMLKEGRERCIQTVYELPLLMAGDVSQTPFGSSSFDLVLAMGLMDYLDDEALIYREIHRVLKPGGIAIITYSNKFSYSALLRACAGPILKFIGAKKRVLGSAVVTRSHTRKNETRRLKETGLEPLDTLFGGAHLIPFNLVMPRLYFTYLRFLQRVYRAIRFNWGMSSFNLVVKKCSDSGKR